MEPEAAFGEVLRELRRRAGLSQEALALEAGIQRNYVSLIERGLNSPSLRVLFKLAQTLQVSTAELMDLTEKRLGLTGKRIKAKAPR